MTGLKLVLPEFEGPLDLLLYLIKASKIDIYDIPIAEITNQYLAYLHQMNVMKLDTVGDYLVMASNLMEIKSKLLLPKPEIVTEDETEIALDPRDDLVNQLLSYQTYKAVAADLKKRADKRSTYFVKAPTEAATDLKIPLQAGIISLNQLQQTMTVILKRQLAKAPVKRAIKRENVSIKTQIHKVLAYLKQAQGPVKFSALLLTRPVDHEQALDDTVTTFLAILELTKNGQVDCQQTTYQDDLFIQRLKG